MSKSSKAKQDVLIPDYCNSFSGCEPPNDHCRDCSHAYFEGTVESNGKNHKFEFNPQYGAQFLRADGEPRKRQPVENNPVWNAWEIWFNGKFK